MSTREHSTVTAGLVYLGAVILVGLPAGAIVSTAFGTAFEAIAPTWAAGSWAGLVVLGISLLIGLQLAVEAAALQLGGVDALDRGPAWLARLRYLGLTASVALALLASAWLALSVATGGYGTAIVVLGLLVAGAVVLVFVRGAGAFVDGFRSA